MMLDIARLGIEIDARQVRNADGALDDFAQTGERAEKATDKVSSAMKRAAQAAAAVASALAIMEAIKIADEMALLDARLKLATTSMREFAQAQREVYDIAQKNSASIASVTDLYTKLSDPIRRAGGGMKEVRGIVDAFSTALRVGGASADEASRAILQFSQAMGQGKLSGDEFTSIAESSPRFMKALAEGANLPIEQLKKLGSEGKLTADIVGNALLKSLDKLNKEAESMPDTVGGAFTRLKNDIAVSLRDINDSQGYAGITQGLAGVVDEMRKFIPLVRDELIAAFTYVSQLIERNRAGLLEMWQNAKGLVSQVWELAKAAASVLMFLAGWGSDTGKFNDAITVARYGVALLQDGITYIGAGFAHLGSVIMQVITHPLIQAGEVAARIVGAFDTDKAAGIRATMAGINEFVTAGAKYGAQVQENFNKGDSAVMRLDRSINGVKLTTNAAAEAAKKASDAFDLLKKGKGEADEKAAKAAARELEKQADLMAKLSGLNADFTEQWDRLGKMFKSGKLSLEGLTKAQADLLALQPFMKQALEDEANGRKAAEKFAKDYAEALSDAHKPLQDQIDAAKKNAEEQERLAAAYGKSATEIGREELARLQSMFSQRAALGLTLDQIDALEKMIEYQKRSNDATGAVESTEKQKKAADQIEETFHDTWLDIGRGGESAFDRLDDALKNGLLETLYQMTAKKWVMNIAGMVTGSGGAVGSVAQATSGSIGGISGAWDMGKSALGALSGGGLGTGFMGSLAGGLNGAGVGSGLTSGMGLAIGESIAGVVGPSVAAGISSAMSMAAAAMPWLAGLAVAVAVWKKLDTSGTYHAGGAASASSAGVQAISAGSLNMEKIQTNGDTQKMVGQLAQSVVGILDSTALAFGKTAGYTAATAFADDTSKDGAWGSLMISKLGQSVVNWQDSRGGGKWAQKTFADGEEGQKQYLAAMAGSVRDALNSIGLPAWATKMLDGLGQGATIEELGEVVAKINQTQAALAAMRAQLDGFAGLTDGAVSSLMAASGGIENLFANASGYYDNFYSEGEKSAKLTGQVAKAFADANLQMPTSRDNFRAMVEASLALGEAGAPTAAKLLAMQSAVAALYPEIAKTATAARDAADVLAERNDLQEQLDKLTLTETQLLGKQRAALDASNQALFDQVQVAQAARDAHDEARESLQDLADEYRSFAQGLEAFGLSLVTGSLSTLSTAGQESAARAQYEKTTAAALAGDKGALADFEKVATQFLTISQKANGGDSKYMSDYANVLAMTDKLASYATDRADAAMMQLAAAERSAKGIEELVAIMRSSEATLASLAVQAPAVVPQRDVGSDEYVKLMYAGMAGMEESIRASAKSSADAAAQIAAMQAQENARVTLAGAQIVAQAVTSSNRRRATADNTAIALD